MKLYLIVSKNYQSLLIVNLKAQESCVELYVPSN